MAEAGADDDDAIAHTLLNLLARRAADSSICPSEAARALGGDAATWRARMPAVRAVAARLAVQGQVRLTRGAATLDPHDLHTLGRGAIRVRRGPRFAA